MLLYLPRLDAHPLLLTPRDEPARALDAALSLAQRLGSGDDKRRPLSAELRHLERLHDLALRQPLAWQEAVTERREEAALWLYGVALGVAAHGLHTEALVLLNVLPGVAAGAEGRRALLLELVAAALAERGPPACQVALA